MKYGQVSIDPEIMSGAPVFLEPEFLLKISLIILKAGKI